MRFKSTIFLLSALLFSTANASTLTFPDSAFSIDSLDATPTLAGGSPLTMRLPAQNGFAPNVNVQIQPYPGTLKQYVELSVSQFSQYGLNVIQSDIKNNIATLEYTGVIQGLNAHYYANASKKGNFVYLVTATDSIQNWNNSSQKLIKTVNSFKLN